MMLITNPSYTFMQKYIAYLTFLTRKTYVHALCYGISKWSDRQDKLFMMSKRDLFFLNPIYQYKIILGFQILFR